MRLSSSSLLIASARISCSVRSEKRFTSASRWENLIRSILNYSPGSLTTKRNGFIGTLPSIQEAHRGIRSMKAVLQSVRCALEPVIRRVLHVYWRFARGLTFGARALVVDDQR